MDLIKRLRHRFIFLAAVSIFIIVSVALLSINWMSARSMQESCLKTMSRIADNGGGMPMREGHYPTGTTTWFIDSDWNDDTREAYYSTRYFSVTFSSGNKVMAIHADQIAAYTESEAVSEAIRILASRQEAGFYEKNGADYGFLVRSDARQEKLVVVVDASREFMAVRSFMNFSFRFGLVCIVLFIIIFASLSNRAIQPFIHNFENQKRFITNASHELKTPIAIISVNAEALEMVNGENEWTQGILKQVHRLSNLINHLILLSKMGEGSQFQMQKALVNVSEVASNTVGSFQLLAAEQHKKVEADMEKDVRIQTDEKCFLELLNIFLDNAVKYCDEGGTIRLTLRKGKKDGTAALAISNDYAAGEHEDYTRFFERFYRSDESHNSAKAGYGIGLSMAREILGMLKGKIRVSWKDGRITFSMVIPSL